jgi:hypothetical protein
MAHFCARTCPAASWVRCGRSTAGSRRDAGFGGRRRAAAGPGRAAARWGDAAPAGPGAVGLRGHQGVLRRLADGWRHDHERVHLPGQRVREMLREPSAVARRFSAALAEDVARALQQANRASGTNVGVVRHEPASAQPPRHQPPMNPVRWRLTTVCSRHVVGNMLRSGDQRDASCRNHQGSGAPGQQQRGQHAGAGSQLVHVVPYADD